LGDTSNAETAQPSSEADTGGIVIGLVFIVIFLAFGIFIIYKIFKMFSKFFFGKSSSVDDTKPTEYYFSPNVLEQIKKYDPEFNPSNFMNRARETSERLQASWSSAEMLPVRNFLSQGLYNRFKQQLELMISQEKVRNVMGDYKVLGVSVDAISASLQYHTLHVKIKASARDVEVPADSSNGAIEKAVKSAAKEAFAEVYSFTRKIGVKTSESRDMLKGQCPNCGYIPDNFSQINKCPGCGSIYNSGDYDWVLSEITQLEEWKESSSSDVPSLAELEGRNLSINREIIEDRASYIFWRWIAGRARGSSAPLARDIASGANLVMPQSPEFIARPAIGAADLESVNSDNAIATARVKILWSASFSPGEEPYHQEHVFVLTMPLTLKNPYGLADHSCSNCGAPLPDTDALKCSYCGADLPNVVNDWLLSSIEEINWERG
jgi:rubrerythrin